ncbi:DUF3240 family protein [Dyella silvae]|uniref:DUF3240 family protein n=1 Tax=Dyella silvae TaxID=2994424 RepID=UPI002264E9A4|nr:DUF3240 family protein [Dyella silvae]
MPTELKRLTLVAPRNLEEELVTILLGMQPALPGFTTTPVAGHGENFDGASVHERVRGRIDRVLLWLVLPADAVMRVVTTLTGTLPNSDVVWWIEPVETMGRLA